jgi:hypothetical protein
MPTENASRSGGPLPIKPQPPSPAPGAGAKPVKVFTLKPFSCGGSAFEAHQWIELPAAAAADYVTLGCVCSEQEYLAGKAS